MSKPARDLSVAAEHVAFADALARWIEQAGVVDADAVADLAVGFADILHASAAASRELEDLLALDPASQAGADVALAKLGYLRALFVNEIKHHADDLERRWDILCDAIANRATDDGEDNQ
jgi:hypothetical protein